MPDNTTSTADCSELEHLSADLQFLRQWTTDDVIDRGIKYFKDHRVVEIDWTDTVIHGVVEDEELEGRVYVDVGFHGGEPRVDCECLRDASMCEHAVAAVYAWEASKPADRVAVETAADRAIADRIKRGRREVEVEHVEGDGVFGSWRANTVSTERPSSRPYRVQIRSLTERANYCECPDFASNRLGTCKHIEAVVHRIHGELGLDDDDGDQYPRPEHASVHLAWDVPDAPKVRIELPPELPEVLGRELRSYFDDRGILQQPVIETFHRLARRMRDEPRVHVGDDAWRHVERLAEDASQAERGRRIREEILRSNGHLRGVHAHLYPYQVEGVAFLASRGRAVLADDMGLGKTLQAIAAATWLMQNEGVRRTLVVCPASLKHQWAREIERFTDAEALVVEGRPDGRIVQYRKQAPFAIINYELVLRDWEEINRIYGADLLVLDEAQRIKNWRTKTADTIKALENRFAFVLTGTPLENRLEDLYSVMQVVDRRVLGPLWRFMIDFHVTDEDDRVLGYRNLSELRRRLAPVMLRRDRREVRDQLPDRIQHRLDVEMTARQKALHDEAVSAAASISQIRQKRPLTPTERNRLMASLQRARMACNAAGLVDENAKGSPKLDELEELLEELCIEGGQKVVVFSEWKKMTSRVVERAQKLGLGTVYLSGDVPTNKRGDLLERFDEDPAAQVFVSTDAGGTGLNLQVASALINLDVPWNPAVLEQRIGRVHRLGQEDSVQVILMMSANSYEERVANLVGTKQHLFDHVVSPDAELDVVGLSKKALDWIDDSLDDEKDAQGEEPEEVEEPEEPESAAVDQPPAPEGEAPPTEDDTAPPIEDRTNEVVDRVQRRLGKRIERVLAVGGGFVVVVDEIDELADAVAESASNDEVEVTVFDRQTVAKLGRLGSASPLAEAVRVDEPDGDEDTASGGVTDRIERKLRAAQVLMREGMPADAVELAAESVCRAVAAHTGTEPPPDATDAAVWLYAQAVPETTDDRLDVTAATRLLSMAAASSIPGPLAGDLLGDARRIVAGLR